MHGLLTQQPPFLRNLKIEIHGLLATAVMGFAGLPDLDTLTIAIYVSFSSLP